MAQLTRIFLLLFCFTFQATALLYAEDQPAEVTWQDAQFDASNGRAGTINLIADHRLDYGDEGTIEIKFELGVDSALPFPETQSLLANAADNGTRFDVQIRKGGTEIALNNGRAIMGLPFDFRGTGSHIAALITRGDRTTIYIDGEKLGSVPLGYGDANRLALHIGGEGSTSLRPFFGYMTFLRIWDRPLSRENLKLTENAYGEPTDDEGGSEGLVLYSVFNSTTAVDGRDGAMFYTRPISTDEILTTDRTQTSTAGSAFHDLLQPGLELTSVDVWTQQWIRSIKLTLNDRDGRLVQLPKHGFEVGELTTYYIPEGEKIVAISGRYGQYIDSIKFHYASGKESPLLGGTGGPIAYRIDVPKGAKFNGLVGNADDNLAGLALSYNTGPMIDVDISGRWVPDNARLPKRDDDMMRRQGRVDKFGQVIPHGNYTDQQVMVLRSTKQGQRIVMQDSSGMALAFDSVGNRTFAGVGSASGMQIKFVSDKAFDFVSGSKTQRVNRVKSYPVLGQEFQTFGSTFTVDHLSTFYENSFIGYDINQMDPRDLQRTDGHASPVFKMPALDSRDYTNVGTGVGKSVPHGMYLLSDIQGREGSFTTTVSNSEEHNSSWSFGLGMSLGVEGIGASGFNVGYSTETKKMQASERTYSLNRSVFQKYAAVIDDTHMQLDDDFVARVYELRDKLASGELIDWRREFIERYGTHYAHAITFGGMATREMSYSKSMYLEMKKAGWTFSQHSEATVEGVTAKRDINAGHDWSDEFKNEVSKEVSSFKSVGGEPTAGGGFSVGREEVPIMMDLRPLTDLFNPVNFDDGLIYTAMRQQLSAALKDYGADSARQISSSAEWEPYVFAVTATKLTVNKADELDGALELYGEIYNNGVGPVGEAITAYGGNEWPFKRDWHGGRDNSIDEGSSYDVPDYAKTRFYAASAKEICGGGYGAVGGWLKDENYADSSDTEFYNNQLKWPWRDLTETAADRSVIYTVSNDHHAAASVTLYGTAQRIEDMDGGYRPLPSCQ